MEITEKNKQVGQPSTAEQEIDLKNYGIVDPSNVMGIFPFIKKDSGDFKELNTPFGFFKRIENPKIIKDFYSFEDGQAVNIENTRYSLEYINQAKKIGSVWFDEHPQVFMEHDKEGNLMRDRPLMLIFGFKMCIILAPRVEQE
jgi:hypothetical protein